MKLSFCLLLLISFSACSQKNKDQEKEQKQTSSVINSSIPAKTAGWVADFEGIFTKAEVKYLDSIISRHEKETTNEIALVTYQLDSSLISTSEDFNKYSISLFRLWGVGKKDRKNGIGVLIATELKRIRIEVGYGLESKLTDEEAKAIIDTIIVPEFKKAAYFKGISKGLEAIINEIK